VLHVARIDAVFSRDLLGKPTARDSVNDRLA
jgi:hypothetical protein